MQVGIKVSDPEVKKQYGGAKQYYLYSVRGEDAKGTLVGMKVRSRFIAVTRTSI